MAEVKKRYPKNAVIASLMVASTREAWHEIVTRTEDAGADGLELNFGCPHGMSERGMGSAVGQVPEYAQMITEWVKEKARTPVLVKLTPNISDIRMVARAAKRGGADGLSAINTINSITGIDLDTFVPRPNVDGKSSHGGYCGPAVKPIALNMVQQILADPEAALPLSGIGGIGTWRDAAEFLLLGCGTVQVCTAVMHYGYRIVEDMAEGLDNWMREKGFKTLEDFRGLSLESRDGVEAPEPELQDRGAHRRAEVHWLRSVPHCVLGWRAPVHSSGSRDRAGGWACGTASDAGGGGSGESGVDCGDAGDAQGARGDLCAGAVPDAARADSAGGRDGVRGLQFVLAGLPGGWMHHDGARWRRG